MLHFFFFCDILTIPLSCKAKKARAAGGRHFAIFHIIYNKEKKKAPVFLFLIPCGDIAVRVRKKIGKNSKKVKKMLDFILGWC